jgi:hypothetical protein
MATCDHIERISFPTLTIEIFVFEKTPRIQQHLLVRVCDTNTSSYDI